MNKCLLCPRIQHVNRGNSFLGGQINTRYLYSKLTKFLLFFGPNYGVPSQPAVEIPVGKLNAKIYMIRPMLKKHERLLVQNFLLVAQKILTSI
jgi:hypothetical protein